MEMVRGLMFPDDESLEPPELLSRGGDTREDGGENSYSASATSDWKYTRILVLGNRKEHLKQKSSLVFILLSKTSWTSDPIRGWETGNQDKIERDKVFRYVY